MQKRTSRSQIKNTGTKTCLYAPSGATRTGCPFGNIGLASLCPTGLREPRPSLGSGHKSKDEVCCSVVAQASRWKDDRQFLHRLPERPGGSARVKVSDILHMLSTKTYRSAHCTGGVHVSDRVVMFTTGFPVVLCVVCTTCESPPYPPPSAAATAAAAAAPG